MMKNKKGFTLVELLAVIVILAIILAIAIPSITSIVASTKQSSFESNVKMLIKGIEYKILENPGYDTSTLDETNVDTIGGDPAQYYHFEVTGDNPVEVSIKTASNSKFGVLCVEDANFASVNILGPTEGVCPTLGD